MRKALLLGGVLTLAFTGVAYAAFSNTYIVNTKFTPVKSGTKKKPIPIGATLSFTVGTNPAGNRPAVIEKVATTISGIQENTNDFPICSSSRLLTAGEGPSSCAKGSLVGSGYFVVEYGATSKPATSASSECSIQASLYNAGHHTLVLYIYRGTPQGGKPVCPAPTSPVTINVTLTKVRTGLTASYTIPAALRHPAPGLDAVPVAATINIPVRSRIVKVKGTRAKTKTKSKRRSSKNRSRMTTRRVGLFESIACPPNHERGTKFTFTLENGTSRSANRGYICR